MNTLDTNTAKFNISSLIQVQQYTMLADAEINIRVDLGDTANPIAGDGLYQIRYDVDGRIRDDYVDVQSGITKTVLQSDKLAVFAAEVVTVYIKGVTADTDVRVTSYVIDVTATSEAPAVFSGALGNSVWTEKEKDVLLRNVRIIRRDVNVLLGKPENSGAISEVNRKVDTLKESMDLTNLENTVNLLHKVIETHNLKLNSELFNVKENLLIAINRKQAQTEEELGNIKEQITEVNEEKELTMRERLEGLHKKIAEAIIKKPKEVDEEEVTKRITEKFLRRMLGGEEPTGEEIEDIFEEIIKEQDEIAEEV